MDRARWLDTIVVVGGLVVGFALPSVLTGSPLARPPASAAGPILAATATVAPAVTFTPVPSATLAPTVAAPSLTPTAVPALASPTPSAALPLTFTPEPSVTTPEPSATAGAQSLASPVSTASPTLAITPSQTVAVESTATVAPSPAITPSPVVYVVRPGDTIFAIAQSFGVTPDAIAAANGMNDPNQLAAGQRLVIPPK